MQKEMTNQDTQGISKTSKNEFQKQQVKEKGDQEKGDEDKDKVMQIHKRNKD